MEPLSVGDLAGDLPRPAVLCTLADIAGKGTIGGGRFESLVLAEARRLLAEGQNGAILKDYTLCREMGQCCGGKVKVLFESCPRRRAVHVFGAGHVGRALAKTLDGVDLEVVVCDPRAEWAAPHAFPAATRVLCHDPAPLARAAKYTAHDAACVMTHDHELDFALVDILLDKPLGFLGLIGSEHKARSFRARLPAPRRKLWDARMHCPIGWKIPSKNPQAIAIATAAQLLHDWAFYRAPAADEAPIA